VKDFSANIVQHATRPEIHDVLPIHRLHNCFNHSSSIDLACLIATMWPFH
jgi:hypothetical protein